MEPNTCATLHAAEQADKDAVVVIEKARRVTDKFACPFCGGRMSKVIKPRMHRNGRILLRRRQCQDCAKRFNTAEKVCA